MSEKKNLLVELFVEELPPKALDKLGNAFAQNVWFDLAGSGLVSGESHFGHDVIPFASPRRLAVLVKEVLAQAPEKQVLQRLMPVSVALDSDGKPTQALLKKLAALGFDDSVIPKLRRGSDGKGEVLALDIVVPGATLAEGLQKALDYSLAKLPIPKVMTYQLADGWSNVQFVRPAHGLVALHGADLVPVTALGLHAGRATHGHRFESQAQPIVLMSANTYAQQLREQGAVIASYAERRANIAEQLRTVAASQGLVPIEDPDLLDEVTALVERPNVLLGRFEDSFLEVPPECLIFTMKANQKYFPLLENAVHEFAGNLTNKFLIVSNISPADPSKVIEGNERVVRPRLADAKFFFDQDRKKSLESRLPALDKVTYHAKFGSQLRRSERVRSIARTIANSLANTGWLSELQVTEVDEVARLAKTDLLTDMVGEFPELQGTMGSYYALNDGKSREIAWGIEDHYKPRFSGDDLPRRNVGLIVALADKLETLVGLFAVGQVPTGDKDPFALRRHGLGVVRILIERSLPVDVDWLVDVAVTVVYEQVVGGEVSNVPPLLRWNSLRSHFGMPGGSSIDVIDFLFDRMAGGLREQSYSANEVDAVLSLRPGRFAEIVPQLAAVRVFSKLPEAEALVNADKRIRNILKKVTGKVVQQIDNTLLTEPAEIGLAQALDAIKPEADRAFRNGDYTASLQALAALREPVDAFFEHVMVNVEDEKLRANRLGLLATLQAAMNRVADLSKLAI